MKKANGKVMLSAVLVFVVLMCSGCASLHEAAKSGNLAEVERLIKEGADVNAKDKTGETPLHGAAETGRKDVVELLISKGANVNAAAWSGFYAGYQTPLHYAAAGGNIEIAKLLLSKGAVVSAKTNLGFTPLHVAASKDMAKLLILKGADVNAKDIGGHTPLGRAGRAEVANFLTDFMAGKVRIAVPGPHEDPKEVVAFEAEAKKYRALAVKPELPEDARKYNVQAVAAFKDKQFSEAAEYYTTVLKIAPWWPDGHFNRALILGELNRFVEAMREMNRYLQLVPDAPNARAAQDKIYDWERLESK